MTKMLLKTKKDHAQMRAILDENTKAANSLTLTPAAGALTAGVVNVAHAGITFASSDAVGTPIYQVVSGAVPVGMALNRATGVLSGTPTVVANASFSVRVTDGMGNTRTQAYTLNVAAS